ncbi:unnamed protein product [Prorocentrum cordatum]|uniref:Uncharacterized protein n=1 Tax=Prorocentrum cordatum TaxID=2364126 RepID=A0ABN9TUS2_9DINO|nr:unnamed protein product [Polarella glacialis]
MRTSFGRPASFPMYYIAAACGPWPRGPAYFALLFRLWTLFMPSRLLMFIIVPVKYQVLWDSVVSFLWQVVLSLFESKHGRMLGSNGGLIAEAMEFEGFGYLVARPVGVQFLPRES